jgi:hypothetical protein
MTLDTFRYIIPQPTIFECYTPVKSNDEKWILGDAEGRIYSLSIQNEEFIFNKLGEVQPYSDDLRIDFDSIGACISPLIDFICWVPFRRYITCLPRTCSPPKADNHHKSRSHIGFPHPSPISFPGWRTNHLFWRLRTRNAPSRPSRSRN